VGVWITPTLEGPHVARNTLRVGLAHQPGGTSAVPTTMNWRRVRRVRRAYAAPVYQAFTFCNVPWDADATNCSELDRSRKEMFSDGCSGVSSCGPGC
jgi:hypothetical protein